MRYKVGVVGCGNIYPRHLEAIRQNFENFELVGVCDTYIPTLIKLEELGAKTFENYKRMFTYLMGNMNLVVVATPNHTHKEIATKALQNGYNVLIEKPVDLTLDGIEELIRLAKRNHLKAWCVLQVRYNPTVQAIKKLLAEKALGDIRILDLVVRWQRPESYYSKWYGDETLSGGVLYEVGIHYIDVLQYLFGVPEILGASAFKHKSHNNFRDTVHALTRFENGASGSIEVTIAAEPSNLECSLSVMGTLGYIKVGGKALDKIEIVRGISLPEVVSVEPNSYGSYVGSCPNHPILYSEIAKGNGFPITEAINSIKIIEEIYKITR